MLNFGICASLVSALIAGNVPATTAPTVWNNANLRISHAAEVGGIVWTADSTITTIVTDDGHGWRIEGELDPSRLYAVVFDTCGTDNIKDDRVLLAVAMD